MSIYRDTPDSGPRHNSFMCSWYISEHRRVEENLFIPAEPWREHRHPSTTYFTGVK